jgi:hypothetical protein
VAKLFATEGKSAEQEPIFKAVNQSLNSFIALRDKTESIVPNSDRRNVRCTIGYPVIVCSSFARFFQVDLEKESGPAPIGREFIMEVNYGYPHPSTGRHTSEYLLIDVVPLDRLGAFLAMIQNDAELVGDFESVN